MQALFEQAIAEKTSQHFPLLWRCYMSYEICRGRSEAARRVLLRAVHTCPGVKALWLDGLHFLAEQVTQSAELAQEYLLNLCRYRMSCPVQAQSNVCAYTH